MKILERTLKSANVYDASRRLIGASNEMQTLVDRVAKPTADERLLDFGCGNGRLVPFLPPCKYTGVDNNPSYIEAAQQEHGSADVTFVCADVKDLRRLGVSDFDLIISLGVLHHLPDDVAQEALTAALGLLKPGGRMVTMDPCFEPSQHSVARVLMALDRGKYVRHPADYERLIQRAGGTAEQQIWTDVYKFPYTHCVQVVRPVSGPTEDPAG